MPCNTVQKSFFACRLLHRYMYVSYHVMVYTSPFIVSSCVLAASGKVCCVHSVIPLCICIDYVLTLKESAILYGINN